MSSYWENVREALGKRRGGEPEFVQAAEAVLTGAAPYLEEHPEFERTDLLGRMTEPERMVSFRVCWQDDGGQWHTNTGWRCQFNGALGPYKGGLRFQAGVGSGVIRSLAFSQTFKNALTGLPMGGGKGGADFDPRGRSAGERMAFCRSFMEGLLPYIGPDRDVPAGDMGVGSREIGYLFGAWRHLRGSWEGGVLTGKDLAFGGSPLRPEATGWGAVYYLKNVLEHRGESLKGKTIACSGYGNVCWGVCDRAAREGARVISISGREGTIYDPAGVNTEEKLGFLLTLREPGEHHLWQYAEKFGARFFPGEKPWGIPADIAMPCAVQNEVDGEAARRILDSGARYYIETANMPTTPEAQALLRERLTVAPYKAVNAGGVAVSGLEMSQNSQRLTWTPEEVDRQLRAIMDHIFRLGLEAGEAYGVDLAAGTDIAAFRRVAEAMEKQGVF